MIRFFAGLIRTIVLDVISVIVSIYERSIIKSNGSLVSCNGYKTHNIQSPYFSCDMLSLRFSIKQRFLHIDLRGAHITIPESKPHHPHYYPQSALELIETALYKVLQRRLLITGDRISITYKDVCLNLRNILYRDSLAKSRKAFVNYEDNRLHLNQVHLSQDRLVANRATAILKRAGESTKGSSDIPIPPIDVVVKQATIVVDGKPHQIRASVSELQWNSKIHASRIILSLNKYKFVSLIELEYHCESKYLSINTIQAELGSKIAAKLNGLLRAVYPAPIHPKVKTKRTPDKITIREDYLVDRPTDSEDTLSSGSSSCLTTQVNMINEYINANPYKSYIPIVDKSAMNREIIIGIVGINWEHQSKWLVKGFKLIDQQDATYVKADDISIHHPGILHISRNPTSNSQFIVRVAKQTNQLIMSPFSMYLNSDLSRLTFGEIYIIKRLMNGVETGGGSMWGYISIEGFRISVCVHTDITIGRIDINDAELEIGSWQIWCPANWGEVGLKYGGHIREQIYKDANMKALLGRSPLSPIGSIIGIIDSIKWLVGYENSSKSLRRA